jgi:hypothetical protein
MAGARRYGRLWLGGMLILTLVSVYERQGCTTSNDFDDFSILFPALRLPTDTFWIGQARKMSVYISPYVCVSLKFLAWTLAEISMMTGFES